MLFKSLLVKSLFVFFVIGFGGSTLVFAQKKSQGKYPSLMWEISGKGLAKPSYLFGTMHVSSKLAFHLSDSFYYAIKSCDAVGLELNPQVWQPEMYRMEDAQRNIRAYTVDAANDYLNENSFKLKEYEAQLKIALSEAPAQVNGLLYRSFTPTADFEENTYLDLYIYQTGRKLGKRAAGVEDFFETEKLIIEAYQDMMKEKKKKKTNTGDENYYELEKKIQDAYRKGDLDLMDSLQKLISISDAFTEKFLYKRNEIQANSIDSILKKQSLFVGVGAAHLPGDRGVIELLRKMGYNLRPVKMADRDADQKDKIDKLKVPVEMQHITTEDGFVQLRMPGKLYKRTDSKAGKSWQYADMENGSYYMISRVKTNAGLVLQSEAAVLKKIDSLLYESIPGKIIQKHTITKNKYTGYDIINKTRRGDLQRYNILVTPFEVLIFKMSGNDDYVNGKEADEFFSSIQLSEQKNGWNNYATAKSGFSMQLPQQPYTFFNRDHEDDLNEWQYAATDKNTGAAYVVWKKNLQNYRFLEEDTFDISLIEESFKRGEYIEKQTSRKQTIFNGFPALDMQFALKSGGLIKAKAFIKGTNYFLMAAAVKSSNTATDQFFKSFKLSDYGYGSAVNYVDTSLNFIVQTPVVPVLDEEIRNLAEQAAQNESLYSQDENYSYWPKERVANFKDDTTGESIVVSIQTFAKYYYIKDTAKFWKNQLQWNDLQRDFIIADKQFVQMPDSVTGYKYNLLDTNSSRKIKVLALLKDNKLFKLQTLTDTLTKESNFISQFYASFKPESKKLGPSIFENKLDQFFNDYNSKDSAIKKKANSAIAHIYYGREGIEKIKTAIGNLKLGDKDYFDLKAKFIYELGYIDDTCCTDKVINYLQDLYVQTADTSSFQNPVITSLVRLKTSNAYKVVKDLLLQDPPVFEGDYGYSEIFNLIQDSLALAKTMFPEVLQLTTLDDYKQPVNNLLRILVDSGYLKSTDYETHFSKLYFDAKVELKKQQSRDEKVVKKENDKDEDDESTTSTYKDDYYGGSAGIDDYAILLMPFYDRNVAVQKYFDKLLMSKDESLKMSTAILMLRNNKKVPDSIFASLAMKDQYRSRLYANLERIKRVDVFPAAYNNQEALAKSFLLNDGNKDKFHELVLVGKRFVELKEKKGYVYFFKYKFSKDDDWQMGISGIQPVNLKQVNSNDDLVRLTGKKINTEDPVIEQFEKQLKELIFGKRKSAISFFESNRRYKYDSGNYED